MSFAIKSPDDLKCPFCWRPISIEDLQVSKIRNRAIPDFPENAANNLNNVDNNVSNARAINTSQSANSGNKGEDDGWDGLTIPQSSASDTVIDDGWGGLAAPQTTPVGASRIPTPPPIIINQPPLPTSNLLPPDAFNPDGTVIPSVINHTGDTLHCSRCGQAIPRDYLLRKSFSISFIGVSGSGKTSFLAAMTERFTHSDIQNRYGLTCKSIHQNVSTEQNINARLLQAHRDFQQQNSNKIPIPSRTLKEDTSLFVNVKKMLYQKPYIFTAGMLRASTQAEEDAKSFWNLTTHSQDESQIHTTDETHLVFHDIVGGFLEDEGEDVPPSLLEYLRNNDAKNIYLIMYNPALNSAIIDRHNNNLIGTDRDEVEYLPPEFIKRQILSLNHLQEQYCAHAPMIIILVTKFDMYKRLFIDFIKNGAGKEPQPQNEEDAIQFGKLFQYSRKGINPDSLSNLDFLWRISDYLKSFLGSGGRNDDEFFSTIRHLEQSTKDKRILCLPISALGSCEAGTTEDGKPYITSYRPIWVEIVIYLLWNTIHKELEKSPT